MSTHSSDLCFRVSTFTAGAVLSTAQLLWAQVPTFPGAEGYGKATTGGRGGTVYEVTNLNDSGAGSLRAAVQASGARTVVFKVSGTIDLKSQLEISNPNITIAGQTAPGDGIALKRYPLVISADNVALRYLRVRLGNESGNASDNISNRFNKNIIVDHVSTSWSVDESLSIYHSSNVTVQWSIVAESLYNSNHPSGSHGFGGIWGGDNSTYHHNLIASNSSRNVRFASGSGNTDYRNNVIYNWGYNSAYGGEKVQPDSSFVTTNINMVGNYYKPGPATVSGSNAYRIVNPSTRDGAADYGKWYVAGNVVEGNAAVTADNWNGGVQPSGGSSFNAGLKLSAPWAAMALAEQTASEAYLSVLDYAGAKLPKRDSVDTRIVNDARTGTATYEGPSYRVDKLPSNYPTSKKTGIIDTPADVGGWPILLSTAAPADADKDGMPDAWELVHGLNPNLATDRNGDFDSDGYTNLEEYINDLGAFPAPKTLVFTNTNGNSRYSEIGNWSYTWQPSRFDAAQINAGTIKIDAPDQQAKSLSIAANSGNVAALSVTGGWLDVQQTIAVGPGGTGTVTQSGGVVRSGTSVVIGGSNNAGTYNLSGGTLATALLTKGAKGGTFNFTGGTLHADTVAFSLTNQGGILAPGSDSILQLIAAASMPDSNGNTEAVRSLIGSTHVMGHLALQSGTLQIDLASLSAFDSINVDQLLTLGGRLDVGLVNGYLPQAGDRWLIGTAGSITGSFASLTAGFTTQVAGGSLFLTFVPEPGILAALPAFALIASQRRRQLRHRSK